MATSHDTLQRSATRLRFLYYRNLISPNHLCFFFIEIGTRRVHFTSCTDQSTQAWVTQQARELIWTLNEENTTMRFLIRDRDDKFSASFEAVFKSQHIDIIQTPFIVNQDSN